MRESIDLAKLTQLMVTVERTPGAGQLEVSGQPIYSPTAMRQQFEILMTYMCVRHGVPASAAIQPILQASLNLGREWPQPQSYRISMFPPISCQDLPPLEFERVYFNSAKDRKFVAEDGVRAKQHPPKGWGDGVYFRYSADGIEESRAEQSSQEEC
ncbi:hypothetical protein BD779DRAFT_1471947 [Infundibulicybe gibba]|nr:hypothetical protein BD779DRAFT_1471947 [Infundibulicybe gibba]